MRYKYLAAALTMMIVVAGCSSAKNTASSSSSTASNGATTAKKVTVGRFSFPSGAATGSTIKIGIVNSNNQIPQVVTAAQAAVKYANANLDGINGHKIELVVCDEQANPATASTCTPKFVQNQVAAVIGYPLVWLSIGGLTGLAAAHIPYLGIGTSGPAENAADAYPMFGGDIQILNFVTQFKAQHVKTVNYLSVNFPANVASAEGIDKSVWGAAGITVKKEVFYTSGAADVTTPAAQAIQGNPDAIYVNNGPQDVVRAIAAIRQDGYKGKIFATYSALAPQLYPASASVMKGVTVETGQLLYFQDTANPEVALMHTILGSAGISSDSYAQTGVAQVLTLADMGDKIGGDPTGQSFLNYLKHVAGQDVFMGYQMNISQVPSNQPTLSHVTNVFSRFMSYDGKSFNYVSGWVSAFGTAGNG